MTTNVKYKRCKAIAVVASYTLLSDVNFIHQFKNLKMKYNIYSTFIVDRIKHIVTYDADPVKPFNLGTITDEYTLLKNFRTLKELNKYVTEKFNI